MQLSAEAQRRIASFTADERRRFYLKFAHSLTISIRAIWSDGGLSAETKVDWLKWMNEVMHRVLNLARAEGLPSDFDAAQWSLITAHIQQCPEIEDHIDAALASTRTL